MDTIELEIRIDQKVDINVRIDEIIEGINNCEMKYRWNYIGQILNAVQLDISDLSTDQRELVKTYLWDKLSFFTDKKIQP